MAEAVGEAAGLARVLRLTALVALASCAIVVVVALLFFGFRAAALAAAGSAVGLLNLWVAAGALRKVPVLFIGTSVPRLALVTGVLLVLVLLLGPVAVWALIGLLVTQVAEVGMMLRHGLHEMRS
jgi:hypothetical protein